MLNQCRHDDIHFIAPSAPRRKARALYPRILDFDELSKAV